jgi:phosphatidylserine/phosphatidylglycerophosphate/cardiolipin synthase-like enzyme
MKQKLLLFIMMLLASSYGYSQISIAAARAQGAGATVTIKGIVTNGSELGSIRYLQDTTAGVAAYSSSLANVNRGDSVLLTGTLKDYNQLLEMDPVSSVTVLSTGNALPTPEVIVPDSLNENHEGELVRINGATFTTNPGGTFSSNTSYNFTANGQTSSIYVRSNHPLIGTIIPMGMVDIIGITSQYSYTSPTSGYQLLCRDTNDIIMNNSIAITSTLGVSNISQTGLTISWSTNVSGTSELMYGDTPTLGNTASASGSGTSHSVSITGLTASELTYVKAFSVDGTDTAFSNVKTTITQSASTGNVITYFNTPVDNSVSTGTDAVYLQNAIDDTLIAYINRAKSTIDFTMYNFTESGISSVSSALNAAYSRGVTVRMIFDGSAGNTGVQNVVAGVKKVGSPTSSNYGIMHNKFIVIDAYDTDPNVPLVWTGSTNLTDGQINTDPNSVVIVQDKSLAIAYTLEFNEMFGSTTAIPDMNNIKFGPDKMDNTPHKFIIGGKDVDCYFSPSDGTNDKILSVIDNADDNISIATMLITRSDIAYALQDAVNNNSVDLKVLVNNESGCSSTVWALLKSLIGNDLVEDNIGAGIMHHKFMIADEGTTSNPTLLVGSHNWSNAANNKNDENTLIFYDNAELTNVYYQFFKYRFDQNYVGIAETGFANKVALYPNPSQGQFTIELNTEHADNYQINIYDLSGKIVMTENQSANAGSNNLTINANELAKGTYVLQMINKEGKRFVNTLVIY